MIDTVPSDDVWTAQHWMAFSVVVRRACLGLPSGDRGGAYAAAALQTLRLQLDHALDAAHAALVAEQRRRWAPGSAAADGPLPDVE